MSNDKLSLSPFEGFPKIARLRRDVVISEKIDGTNSQVWIAENGVDWCAGSRTRWLSHEMDNYGFWHWVWDNIEELRKLGPGHHFGEWWGRGINRGYDLKEKRFSLFNTYRWSDALGLRPMCCSVVPVLYEGPFSTNEIDFTLLKLRVEGSQAALGFSRPEGIVVYHTAAKTYFKQTLEHDEGKHEPSTG